MKLKIVSDGTNAGTKLIDVDTGEMVHGISKLGWEADIKNIPITKVTVEFFNIPVEITSPAKVELLEFDNSYTELVPTKTFDKNIRITSQDRNGMTVTRVNIQDADTNEHIGAVQKIKWEATPEEVKAEVVKVKFDNKDW